MKKNLISQKLYRAGKIAGYLQGEREAIQRMTDYLLKEIDARIKIIIAESENPSSSISDSYVNGWGYGSSYVLFLIKEYPKPVLHNEKKNI